MTAASPPKMIAVGGVCATGIFRVATVPTLPAKTLANRMCRVADGMAVSAACAFARLGGRAAAWARVGDDADGAFIRDSLAAETIITTAVPASRRPVASTTATLQPVRKPGSMPMTARSRRGGWSRRLRRLAAKTVMA